MCSEFFGIFRQFSELTDICQNRHCSVLYKFAYYFSIFFPSLLVSVHHCFISTVIFVILFLLQHQLWHCPVGFLCCLIGSLMHLCLSRSILTILGMQVWKERKMSCQDSLCNCWIMISKMKKEKEIWKRRPIDEFTQIGSNVRNDINLDRKDLSFIHFRNWWIQVYMNQNPICF